MADINDDELRDAVNRMMDNFNSASGRLSGAGSQAANGLNQMASSSTFVQNQFRALTSSSASLYNVDQQRYRFGQLLVSNLKSLVQSSFNATQALYGVSAGFAPFSKSLEDAQSGFNSAVDTVALGLAGTLNPIAVASAVALKTLANFAGGAFFGAMKLQLGLMEQQLGMYKQVNQSGAIFGGSLAQMQKFAQGAGTGIQILGNIIKNSSESIGQLGLSMSLGGYTVANYASTIARTDRAMLNLYGSTEELAAGTADYLSLQAQIGKTDLNNQSANEKGLKEYLRTQKELSDLTGKRTSQLKAEEEQRARDLAYASKLSRLGPDAQRNVREGMALATKLFGDEGAKYAQEYFATNGRVVSESSLRFQNMIPDAASAIAGMVTATDETQGQYRDRVGGMLKANEDVLKQVAKDFEVYAEINFGANNPILKGMTDVGSNLLKNAEFIKNINDLFKKIQDDRAREDAAGPGSIQDTIQKAEKIRLDNQLEIDKMVSKNFSHMTTILETLGYLQKIQIGIAGGAVELSAEFVAWVRGGMKTPRPTETPNPQPVDDPEVPPGMGTNAYGGVVDKPSIAGEDGPEAVIPLAKGNVPLDIDWTPMVRALYELIDKVQEGNDINDRILKASY